VAALQYSPVPGVPAMRAALADLASRTGATVPADRVIVTSGSQQGLDLVARVLLDPGDHVAMDDPSYLGAVQTFHRAGARLLPIPGDDDGIDTGILADRLARGARCKVVYVVPHFHNPTAAVLSATRRAHLAELAETYDFLIVEDDPYADLAFHGDRLPSADIHTDRVIRLLSLSKVLCPGFRVAGMVLPRALVDAVTMAKQCADLQTNTFGQYVLARLLDRPDFLPQHVVRLRTLYRRRAECLATLLTERLPWLRFRMPRGGLFFWCALDGSGADAVTLTGAALRAGVAVVPGPPFCVERDGSRALRLSYATLSPDDMRTAVSRLASAHADLVGAS
jgi:2-aminoadipate transaminase